VPLVRGDVAVNTQLILGNLYRPGWVTLQSRTGVNKSSASLTGDLLDCERELRVSGSYIP